MRDSAAYDIVKLGFDALREWTHSAFANLPSIDRAHRRHFSSGPAQEDFLRDVQL